MEKSGPVPHPFLLGKSGPVPARPPNPGSRIPPGQTSEFGFRISGAAAEFGIRVSALGPRSRRIPKPGPRREPRTPNPGSRQKKPSKKSLPSSYNQIEGGVHAPPTPCVRPETAGTGSLFGKSFAKWGLMQGAGCGILSPLTTLCITAETLLHVVTGVWQEENQP